MIINHPGRVHLDEIIADGIVLARTGIQDIKRRRATEDELKDPSVWVIDTGGEHTPGKHNFDHHQLDDKEHLSSFRLVAQYFGLDEILAEYYDWYLTCAMVDCRGLGDVAAMLGTDQTILHRIADPITHIIISLFSEDPNKVAEALMVGGMTILRDINKYKKRRALFVEHAQVLQFGNSYCMFFPSDVEYATFGVAQYKRAILPHVACSITRDASTEAWSIFKFGNDKSFDFKRLRKHKDVAYIAPTGFMVKTRILLSLKQLQDLLHLTIV